LVFSEFTKMNNDYLNELCNIISEELVPKYMSLLEQKHAQEPLKGGFSHESEDSLKKKVLKAIEEFQIHLKKNIFMISPIKRFYEDKLQESLNVENMEAALLNKIGDGGMNLLVMAIDYLVQNKLDFLDLSLEDPWSGNKIDEKKNSYLMKTMLENLYSHVNENIREILEAQIHDDPENNGNPIDRLEDNLEHIITDLNKKMIETFRIGWPNYFVDFDELLTQPFLEKANIGRFFIKESLNSKLGDLQDFVKEYVDTTLRRTFFSKVVNGHLVNKDLFKGYMQMLDTSYQNEKSILAPLLEHTEMGGGDERLVVL
jgi:hypothetical protein